MGKTISRISGFSFSSPDNSISQKYPEQHGLFWELRLLSWLVLKQSLLPCACWPLSFCSEELLGLGSAACAGLGGVTRCCARECAESSLLDCD